ncbi:MAG: Rid family hydrolase, partial [Quisquiliibacterium sp.]
VYISGLTSRGSDGQRVDGDDAYQQSRIIFGKIAALIQAAGGSIDDVVKLTIFVTDIATNQQVWKARREVFHGDFPASSLVEVSALAKPEILVEIEAIAHLGCAGTGQD